MHEYLSWQRQTITDFSDKNINSLYNEGYVFTRVGTGVMHQTRSLRIDLSKFELSSENRRILNKTADLILSPFPLPLSSYHWSIGKMAKDFYDTKFGKNTMSANKVREILTNPEFKNFNKLFAYTLDKESGILNLESRGEITVGYCVVKETDKILHYSYPFYILNSKFQIPNLGMGMMLRAIIYAQEQNKKYIYLGSFQRPTDVYKLQFEGLEWFDGENWQKNLTELKKIIQNL